MTDASYKLNIILQDLHHFYIHFLNKLNIEQMLIYSSFNEDIFLHYLLDNTSINFLTNGILVNNEQFSKRFKIIDGSCKYIYVYNQPNMADIIDDCIVKYMPSFIITNMDYKGMEYISIPFSLNLYFVIKSNIIIDYLPTIGKLYNFNTTTICHKYGKFTTLRTDEEICYAIRSSDTKFIKSDIEIIVNNIRKKTVTSNTICREDIRWFVYQNNLYGSYTRIDPYISGVKTHATLSIGKFNTDFDIVEEFVPKYGGNLTDGPEKNWTFWESPGGKLHCVYKFTPFTILEFSSLTDTPRDITIQCHLPDLIRGGACGVIYDAKVWCFTHVVREGYVNLGLVVLSHSNIPIVLGYSNTIIESKDFMGLFFYICGAYFDIPTYSWKLTGGAQDTRSCIITIPHKDILSKINWL